MLETTALEDVFTWCRAFLEKIPWKEILVGWDYLKVRSSFLGQDLGFSQAENLTVDTFLFFSFLFLVYLFYWRLITLRYCSGFCHTLIWISHGCTCVPHLDPLSHLPPHPIYWVIPVHQPWAPSHALNLDWRSVSHMIIYMLQCCSLRSSHPRLLPQSPKDCSIHLCLFCCLAYRVIITIFLNSIYMH